MPSAGFVNLGSLVRPHRGHKNAQIYLPRLSNCFPPAVVWIALMSILHIALDCFAVAIAIVPFLVSAPGLHTLMPPYDYVHHLTKNKR
jgi:hypothetical protein